MSGTRRAWGGITGAWDALAGSWNRFWFAGTDGLPLGVVRIGFALAALYVWLETAPILRRYYTDAGELPIADARRWGTEWVSRWLMPDALGSPAAVTVLFVLLGVALVALLVGWRTRLAAGGGWLLLLWFQLRNPTFLNGGDEVLRLTGLYLALAYVALPARDRSLSLDRRAALARETAGGTGDPGGSRGPEGRTTFGAESAGRGARIPAWPLRLMQVQLCVVYVVSGLWKVAGEAWWDGSALVYALDNAAFSRFGLPDWAWLQPVFVVLGISVAWWELLFPLLVAWGRTRRWALLYGVVFHLLIFVTMNIGAFAPAMLALYPAFLTGDELRRLGGRAPPRADPPAAPRPGRSGKTRAGGGGLRPARAP